MVASTEPTHEFRGQCCRPVKELLSRIGGKWTVLVVTRLADGPRRFSDLKREIDEISQKMLTATLRDLERDGFVMRTVTPSIPPRVDYELTELGLDLMVPLEALGAWAVRNQHRVDAARERYGADSAPPAAEPVRDAGAVRRTSLDPAERRPAV